LVAPRLMRYLRRSWAWICAPSIFWATLTPLFGSGGETRTPNQPVNSRLLCRLSYPRSIEIEGTGRHLMSATRFTEVQPLRSQPGTLVGVGSSTDCPTTAVVPVTVVAVNGFVTVLSTLLPVARAAEQLALQGFFDQDIPGSRHASTHGEPLGSRIAVIELKILGRSTPDAAAAQHLDELCSAPLFSSLVVAACAAAVIDTGCLCSAAARRRAPSPAVPGLCRQFALPVLTPGRPAAAHR
jgi:hypothetical protein